MSITPRCRVRRSPIRVAAACAATGVAIWTAGCTTTAPGPARDADVDQLADFLTGWFDSSEQAALAPDDFYDIRLVMVPIWPHRADGRWLYVEQAAAGALDRPYRQRVYHVHRGADGVLRSDVYTLPGDPLAFAGGWSRPGPLDDLDPDDLELREGCSILLTRIGPDLFEGATVGTGCASTLRGAAYATSVVVVRPDRLSSWDRGWNEAGAQVWGAVKAGYEFVRCGDGPPPPGPGGAGNADTQE